jgi:hypothetical protein
MRKAPRAVSRASVVVPRLAPRVALAIALLGSATGCSTYRDELLRCQQSFEHNQHEHALGLMRALEPDVTRLQPPEQAQYAYLRGTTDYRLGYRSDARHWLSLAKAYEDAAPGTLPSDWKARMIEALDELNNVVYSDGLAALMNTKKAAGDDGAPVTRPSSNAKDPAKDPGKGSAKEPGKEPAKEPGKEPAKDP